MGVAGRIANDFGFGSSEQSEARALACDSQKHSVDPVGIAIGFKPVALAHAGDEFDRAGADGRRGSLHAVVQVFVKREAIFVAVVFPVLRQGVVERDVDDDAGYAVSCAGYEIEGAFEFVGRIRFAIDGLVNGSSAANERSRVASQLLAEKVPQNVDGKYVVVFGA